MIDITVGLIFIEVKSGRYSRPMNLSEPWEAFISNGLDFDKCLINSSHKSEH